MAAQGPFHGPLILLRPFEPGDTEALYACLNHPDLAGRRYIPWKFPDLFPLARHHVEGIISQWTEAERESHFAVVRRDTQEIIGHAELDWSWDPHAPSLAVVIAPAHQRRGYASEALGLLLRYFFEHTLAHNVSCWITDWNAPGREFAKRHGFKECGAFRRAGFRQGRYYDLVVADLLRPEWQAMAGGAPHAA
jgi:RimJ/RimL family protein N-acetyltransferase